MFSPIKNIIIVSSLLCDNVSQEPKYFLSEDYSVEAEQYSGKIDAVKSEFMSDILYQIIGDELNDRPVE